jgi:hypothetical protein
VNVDAEARIFQGQIANARNSIINWPLGMVMYRGASIALSEPNGIMFAAMLVPRNEIIQQNAERKTAKRVDRSNNDP